MSKNQIENKLNEIKGDYSLILFSQGKVLDTYIVLAENSDGYNIFIFNNKDFYGACYGIPLKKALKEYLKLI